MDSEDDNMIDLIDEPKNAFGKAIFWGVLLSIPLWYGVYLIWKTFYGV